jgi:hypothetical protein
MAAFIAAAHYLQPLGYARFGIIEFPKLLVVRVQYHKQARQIFNLRDARQRVSDNRFTTQG